MSAFGDQVLLQFQQDAFTTDLLESQLGLQSLLDTVYRPEDITVVQITLAGVLRKEWAMPAFETIRSSGTGETILPGAARTKVDRAWARRGRLAWVDVYLDVLLAGKAKSTVTKIESITAIDLLAKVGPVATLAALRAQLGLLYPASVVDGFFKAFRIRTIEDFTGKPALFLQFIAAQPPVFNPADPANDRTFRVNVCVQIQPELKVGEALQAAKLCRSILENERQHAVGIEGGDVATPYVLVVVFPVSVAVDNAIGSLTGAEVRASVKQLFKTERMFAHFV